MSLADPNQMIRWSLPRIMRKHRVTIREVAKNMGITMKRVRYYRALDVAREINVWEFTEACKSVAFAKYGRAP